MSHPLPFLRVARAGALALLVAATPATAEVERTSDQVRGAAVTGVVFHDDGCERTTVGIWGYDQIARGDAARPEYQRQVEVHVFHGDRCHPNAWEMFGTSTDFVIEGVDRATIAATIDPPPWVCVADADGVKTCGEALGPAELSLTMTGTGEAETGRWTSSYRDGSLRVLDRGSSTMRQAEVTGTFTIGDRVIPLDGLMDAAIHEGVRGTHTITRY